MKKTANILLLFGICFFLFGCGRNIPMSGKVTFSDNREPLTIGMVFFETDTLQARGKLEADGTYRLGTLGLHDGLPPGTYRVFVAGAITGNPIPSRNPERPNPPLSLIDSKFETGATSGLTATVDRKNRVFNFSVDPNLQTRKILVNQQR